MTTTPTQPKANPIKEQKEEQKSEAYDHGKYKSSNDKSQWYCFTLQRYLTRN